MRPTSAKLTTAGDAFARALYSQLAGREGNIAVSPASIESCILLALAGARETTAAVDRPERTVFRADHPFLFAIRNAANGEVLAVGRVVTPEK